MTGEQLELNRDGWRPAFDLELDRYLLRGAGPNGGSARRFAEWLELWRPEVTAGRARILVAADESHAIAVASQHDRPGP